MYTFAIVALMALAVVKLVDFLVDFLPETRGMRTILTFVLALGAMWLLDYSMFEGFGVTVRNEAMGIWMTGFIVPAARELGEQAGDALRRGDAALDHEVTDVAQPQQRADAHAQTDGEPAAGDEAFDETRAQEHRHQPDDDRDRALALLAERIGP